VLGSVIAGSADGSIPDRTVPRGLAFEGRVVGPVGRPVGGALVQLFCAGSTTHCVDPNLPLAETISAANGAFEVVLPDPGVRN
jgi:hypothetical protein